MAAVAGQDTVQMPTDAYKITNTSKAANGTDPGYSIGVVGLSFETVAGGTWGTTLTATPTGATKEMNLTIGGVQMPALAANGHAQPTVDITSVDNTFYDHANSKPKPIAADPNTCLLYTSQSIKTDPRTFYANNSPIVMGAGVVMPSGKCSVFGSIKSGVYNKKLSTSVTIKAGDYTTVSGGFDLNLSLIHI